MKPLPVTGFIDQITYKLAEHGISVILTEESYTSKSSLLDRDDIPVFTADGEPTNFSGQRIKRGLYRSSNGTLLNADINGAGNIIRKVVPDINFDGIVDAVVRPDRVSIDRSGKLAQ